MNDSAIESIIKIQEGLSFVKYNSKRENVLLVEGRTDKHFYEHFTSKTIRCGEPGEESSIPQIVSDNIENGNRIYGIVDPDYKNIERGEKIRNFLFIIDANSLETMIIKYVGINAFEKIIRKKFYRCRFIKNNFTEDSMQWAFKLGCLRKLNEKQKLGLKINSTAENHDFLKEYIAKTDSENYFTFNIKAFINDLVRSNSTQKIDSSLLENSISSYIENDAWLICRGHDIFDFIDALSRTVTNNKRVQGETKVPSWEYELFDPEKKIINKIKPKFADSPLQKWFDKINKESCQ